MKQKISRDKEVVIGLKDYSFSLPDDHSAWLDLTRMTITLKDEIGNSATRRLMSGPDPSKPYALYELGDQLAGGVTGEGNIYAIVQPVEERKRLHDEWEEQGHEEKDYFKLKSDKGLRGRSEFDSFRAILRGWNAS